MRSFGEPRRRRRFIRPNSLFLGIACSFLACCLAGHSAGRHNLFRDFERFHIYLNPGSYFYPTANQVRALGQAKLPQDKIAVIVAGDSITYGVGQAPSEVWTRKLQAFLGDEYRVINLALWGSLPHEFGATAAEMLSADHPRLVCVTITHPVYYPAVLDGDHHRYFFWDAYCKGLLQPDANRDRAVANLVAERHNQPVFTELHTRARVNNWCRFDDLWSAVTYNQVGTVWNAIMPDTWYVPRRKLQDPGAAAPPLERRYSAATLDEEMVRVRGPLRSDACIKDGAGHWIENPASPAWLRLRDDSRRCFRESDRERTLMIVATESPYYLKRLTTDEHDLYFALAQLTADNLEGAGFAALNMGDEFTEEEFADRCHLSEPGGTRLATKVAGRVQRMAVDLGFISVSSGGEP
jgi:hypothetical protein